MATTSVKLTAVGKEDLDRLQARLTLLGHRMTKEEILELALRTASKRIGDLLTERDGGFPELTEAQVRKFMRQVVGSAESWGRTSWRDIDAIVYGWRKYK